MARPRASVDDYHLWAAELGRALDPGTFGENLTVDGLDVSNALIGERWRIGSAIFEVSRPRVPCYKLALRMDDREFPRDRIALPSRWRTPMTSALPLSYCGHIDRAQEAGLAPKAASVELRI